MAVVSFLQYCFCEGILTVFIRENGVKVYTLCHEGTDFSCVVTAMAKNSTTATSNAYQVHFYVSRKLLFVA